VTAAIVIAVAPIAVAAMISSPVAIAIMIAIAVTVIALGEGWRWRSERRREGHRGQRRSSEAFHVEVSFLLPLNRSVQRKVPLVAASCGTPTEPGLNERGTSAAESGNSCSFGRSEYMRET
jgi:hypothetical protein